MSQESKFAKVYFEVDGKFVRTTLPFGKCNSIKFINLFRLLDRRIDEANLDLSDGQVREVMDAMHRALRWRLDIILETIDQFYDAILRRAPKTHFKKLQKDHDIEIEGMGDDVKNQLCGFGIDCEDETVISAIKVAKEVLEYAQKNECATRLTGLLPR